MGEVGSRVLYLFCITSASLLSEVFLSSVYVFRLFCRLSARLPFPAPSSLLSPTPMRKPRPKHEDSYVRVQVAPIVKAFRKDPLLLIDFYGFAVKTGGANPSLFPGRMAHVMRGEAPTAYVFALLVQFGKKRKIG